MFLYLKIWNICLLFSKQTAPKSLVPELRNGLESLLLEYPTASLTSINLNSPCRYILLWSTFKEKIQPIIYSYVATLLKLPLPPKKFNNLVPPITQKFLSAIYLKYSQVNIPNSLEAIIYMITWSGTYKLKVQILCLSFWGPPLIF